MAGAESHTDSLPNSSSEVGHTADHPPAEVTDKAAPGARADREEQTQPKPRFGSRRPEAVIQCQYPGSEDSHDFKAQATESQKMENCLGDSRHEAEKPEMNETTETSGKIEKYNVPLNRLKMMFEKGEHSQNKVRAGWVWSSLRENILTQAGFLHLASCGSRCVVSMSSDSSCIHKSLK